jgi:hypothetical protein
VNQTPLRLDRRGSALAVALFALVIIGALVAGNFSAGWLEQQSGQNTWFSLQAAEAAEAGLAEVLASVAPGTVAALPLGGTPVDLGPMSFGVGYRVERQVSRLTTTLFLVRVLGARQDRSGGNLAVRVIGAVVRLVTDPLDGTQFLAPLGQRSWAQLY